MIILVSTMFMCTCLTWKMSFKSRPVTVCIIRRSNISTRYFKRLESISKRRVIRGPAKAFVSRQQNKTKHRVHPFPHSLSVGLHPQGSISLLDITIKPFYSSPSTTNPHITRLTYSHARVQLCFSCSKQGMCLHHFSVIR